MIAKFRKINRWAVMAAPICAVLLPFSYAQSAQPAKATGAAAGVAPQPAPVDPQGPPMIITTSPRSGDTEVDPVLAEVTVTFDRDMDAGFSWTGGGPEFPGKENGRAQWRDKRTCVLPVKVEAGRFYRVGINAPSFRSFRSADGVPAIPSAILFTTKGASDELKRKATKPS